MRILQFIAQCEQHQQADRCALAQHQITQLLAQQLEHYGFQTLSQSGHQIAVSVEDHTLPLAVTCQSQNDEGYVVCEISSYPEEEQDWLDRITEQSLLNQLAHAVEAALKTNAAFSQFEWK